MDGLRITSIISLSETSQRQKKDKYWERFLSYEIFTLGNSERQKVG